MCYFVESRVIYDIKCPICVRGKIRDKGGGPGSPAPYILIKYIMFLC